MTAPMIGTMHAMIVTKHRRFSHFAAMRENRNAAIVDIMPVGILKSEASTPENPRPEMIRPLKVNSPEDRSAKDTLKGL